MNLSDVLKLVSPDLGRSLKGLAPEIVLVATIVLLLMWRVFQRSARSSLSGVAMVGTLVALLLAGVQLLNMQGLAMMEESTFQNPVSRFIVGPVSKIVSTQSTQSAKEQHDTAKDLFSGAVETAPGEAGPPKPRGMIRFDGFAVFLRLFLLAFTAATIWLTTLTGIPDNEDSPDFYTLLLGATLGMMLMASANHLLIVYIAIEMASLPSYAMAGFLKGRRDASEASLKYVVYGAGASGIMLYGISLLVGRYGTAHIPTLSVTIASSAGGLDAVLLLGLLLLLVGVAFKIAAVPFHFWCPDVFEGAAAEVAGFLSVASKGAALALLARLTISLTSNTAISNFAERPPLGDFLAVVIGVMAAVTATYGNLAAYAQTNLKRLLAFSTIAHAGYMMMPVAAAIAVGKNQTNAARLPLESLAFYLMTYFVMNLGAFAVVALIRNRIRSEDLKDYTGLARRCPLLTVAMAVFLLSLTGIPPLAGFAAKWNVVFVLYSVKLYWLMVVLLANTVFSAFYYVKVLRVMIVDPSDDAAPGWSVPRPAAAFCGLLIAANFGVMLMWKAWDAMALLSQFAVVNLLEPFEL